MVRVPAKTAGAISISLKTHLLEVDFDHAKTPFLRLAGVTGLGGAQPCFSTDCLHCGALANATNDRFGEAALRHGLTR